MIEHTEQWTTLITLMKDAANYLRNDVALVTTTDVLTEYGLAVNSGTRILESMDVDAYILYVGDVKNGVIEVTGVTTSLLVAESWGTAELGRYYQKIPSLLEYFLTDRSSNGVQ